MKANPRVSSVTLLLQRKDGRTRMLDVPRSSSTTAPLNILIVCKMGPPFTVKTNLILLLEGL